MLTLLHIEEGYTNVTHSIAYLRKNTQNTTYVTHSIAHLRRIHKTLHMLPTQMHI